MSWPSVANERRGTVAVFERALTEIHSVRLPRAANERRGRSIDLTEYVITESVCVRPRYRGTAPRRARNSLGIDDSARGEIKQLHAKCECAAFRTQLWTGGETDEQRGRSHSLSVYAACQLLSM